MNLFAKVLKKLGTMWVSYESFLTLLEKVSPRKYDWLVLKHISKSMQATFYMGAYLHKSCKKGTWDN